MKKGTAEVGVRGGSLDTDGDFNDLDRGDRFRSRVVFDDADRSSEVRLFAVDPSTVEAVEFVDFGLETSEGEVLDVTKAASTNAVANSVSKVTGVAEGWSLSMELIRSAVHFLLERLLKRRVGIGTSTLEVEDTNGGGRGNVQESTTERRGLAVARIALRRKSAFWGVT